MHDDVECKQNGGKWWKRRNLVLRAGNDNQFFIRCESCGCMWEAEVEDFGANQETIDLKKVKK
jgi:hypothetical protein